MRTLAVILVLFLASCESKQKTIIIPDATDSLIQKSERGLTSAIKINHKSDSVTHVVVIKKVKELKYLNSLLKIYEKELIQTRNTEVKTIYKTDTVYIETKKSFWGKTKTEKSVKSDSTVTQVNNESTDSTIKIDSTTVN
jgi:hypothetical protein